MYPEVWVLIPFDTLVERFLFQLHQQSSSKSENNHNYNHHQKDNSNNKLEEDFALLVLKSSSSLRQRIVSHLIGQLRELPVASVAVSCRIAVNVLSSEIINQNSTTTALIKDLEIEH